MELKISVGIGPLVDDQSFKPSSFPRSGQKATSNHLHPIMSQAIILSKLHPQFNHLFPRPTERHPSSSATTVTSSRHHTFWLQTKQRQTRHGDDPQPSAEPTRTRSNIIASSSHRHPISLAQLPCDWFDRSKENQSLIWLCAYLTTIPMQRVSYSYSLRNHVAIEYICLGLEVYYIS